MFEALSPPRRRLGLGLLALAVALVLAVGTAVVVRTVRESRTAPQDRPGPVLLVPGYGGTGASLQGLAAELRGTGRDALVVPEVGDGTGDLSAQADALGRFAASVLDRTGAPSVDVVGYSAGGVVARLWVADGTGHRLARRVVSLGAPQHGTTQAQLAGELGGGCPTACEQLVPDSPLLRRLAADGETPPGPVWVTLRSTADQVVTPVDSAALDGALNVVVQQVCPAARTTHAGLPDDPVTRALVRSALGVGPPSAPTVVRC
ncbi:pimeloyl-ACP methyl ester carboxylesterase [Friedmanniella endophytica]|uniref:Pimeloyl-ACP methyl ester carboxylesterase n=1 Tax=Microlunatus kandeliicorticis TaxID=1759536 RepID=A0A7W3IP36_9ACTN|nr:lipase [Microlunatus kandeliicorticis]MBA8792634.1 pimeloyl-ACP methyl ester carboxylesterase [Microlunatus kandeliicorticis]